MPKIIFSMPNYYPTVGGASFYAQELAAGLIQKGYEITVYTNGTKKIEFIHKDVLVKQFPSIDISRDYKVSIELLKAILKDHADIIHSHHYGYFPATAGLITSKLRKTPHVLSTHYHPPIYGRKRWALFALYHLTQGLPILRFSDKILTHSNFEKKMLCKTGANEDTMGILPSIVDVKKFQPSTIKSKDKIVLYVSPLVSWKGYHIALDVAKKILKQRNDVKFVFIGHGSKEIETKFKKEIAKFKKNQIIWKKDIKLNELIKWYRISDIFVLPSMYEAFGRVIGEAQSCETPVVSTKVGAVPEVVKDGQTGLLVDYGDWTAMQEKVNQLLDNKPLRKKMGKAGRKRMVKNFSAEVVVDKLNSIYKSLL